MGETDRRHTRHTREAGDGPPAGPRASPGDADLSQHPVHSLSGSHEKNSSCRFVTTSLGLQVVPRKPSDMGWFSFLEKVPRVTTLKTSSRPRQAPSGTELFPKLKSTLPQTLKAPTRGFPGKPRVPWRPPWDSGAAPQGRGLGGAAGGARLRNVSPVTLQSHLGRVTGQ